MNEIVTTDWVYSIACHIIGIEKTTMPFDQMSMIHMKQFINDSMIEDWTKEFVYELDDNVIKINIISSIVHFINIKSGYYLFLENISISSIFIS
jgi:hypothetical protein